MTNIKNFYKDILLHKREVLKGFRFIYLLVILGLVGVAISSYFELFTPQIYPLGVMFGQLAAFLFCLCLTPGIARRFGVSNNFFTILMLFRRQIGVLMFAFSFLHYAILRLFPVLFGGREIPQFIPVYEILGAASLYALIPLWLTSNDLSVKFLKGWWRRLHSLIYFIVWLIFGHVALQGFSPATVLLGLYAILEIWSLTYVALRRSI